MSLSHVEEKYLTSLLVVGSLWSLITLGLFIWHPGVTSIAVGVTLGAFSVILTPSVVDWHSQRKAIPGFTDLSLESALERRQRIRSIASLAAAEFLDGGSPEQAREGYDAELTQLRELVSNAEMITVTMDKGYAQLRRLFWKSGSEDEFIDLQNELDTLAGLLIDLEAEVNSWFLTGGPDLPVYSMLRDFPAFGSRFKIESKNQDAGLGEAPTPRHLSSSELVDSGA